MVSTVKLKWILQSCQKCSYIPLLMTLDHRGIPNFSPAYGCITMSLPWRAEPINSWEHFHKTYLKEIKPCKSKYCYYQNLYKLKINNNKNTAVKRMPYPLLWSTQKEDRTKEVVRSRSCMTLSASADDSCTCKATAQSPGHQFNK